MEWRHGSDPGDHGGCGVRDGCQRTICSLYAWDLPRILDRGWIVSSRMTVTAYKSIAQGRVTTLYEGRSHMQSNCQ